MSREGRSWQVKLDMLRLLLMGVRKVIIIPLKAIVEYEGLRFTRLSYLGIV